METDKSSEQLSDNEYIQKYVRPYIKNCIKYHNHLDHDSFEICEGCDKNQKVILQQPGYLSLEEFLSQECSCDCGRLATITYKGLPGYYATIECIRKFVPNAKWEDTWVMND